jgi:type IV secretion system protein VirB6
MTTIGLVLTFATSWIAYQSVVWRLATGAPDELASAMSGTAGSATAIFVDRIDLILAVIADTATNAAQGAQGAGPTAAAGSFTPANIVWLSAMLLLLGTVGILITARIGLAVLVAVGPVFVVLGLFAGTRGLTAGWLRGIVLTAVMPLFVVVGGNMIVEMIVPVLSEMRMSEGPIDGRAALGLFLMAAVHIALMAMVGRIATTMVSAWSVFGLGQGAEPSRDLAGAEVAPGLPPPAPVAQLARHPGLAWAAALDRPVPADPAPGTAGAAARGLARAAGQPFAGEFALPRTPLNRRAQGIGSRFAASRPQSARRIVR